MNLEPKQVETRNEIKKFAGIFKVDESIATSIATVESSLGLHLLSPTGCRGVFQMSMIAMKDLWLSMCDEGDEVVGIVCGILFIRLLKKRWGSDKEAISHFCDPKDRDFYIARVLGLMQEEKAKEKKNEEEIFPIDNSPSNPTIPNDKLCSVHTEAPDGEDLLRAPGSRDSPLRALRGARDPRV